VLYGKSKRSWLSEFLELEGGIPSHDTFRRVFGLIDADAFEACFTAWAQSQAEEPNGELVAIDGKTIRRSFDHGKEQSPLHVVSAWASEQSLALAQEVVDEKSNEITAIPEVLDVKPRLLLKDALREAGLYGHMRLSIFGSFSRDILVGLASHLRPPLVVGVHV
jgi:hypothetical protein